MVFLKTKIPTEGKFWFTNFTKTASSDPWKHKFDPQIAICGLLIGTLNWVSLKYLENKNYRTLDLTFLAVLIKHVTLGELLPRKKFWKKKNFDNSMKISEMLLSFTILITK